MPSKSVSRRKDTGGPAFPRTGQFDNDVWKSEGGDGIVIDSQNGMTLRDWFAGMALQGMCANPDISKVMADRQMQPSEVRESFALCAYAQADAMILERAKS